MKKPVCKYCKEEFMVDLLDHTQLWCPNCCYHPIGVEYEEEKTSESAALHQLPCALQTERGLLAGVRGELEARD